MRRFLFVALSAMLLFSTVAYGQSANAGVTGFRVLGGTGAVSDEVLNHLATCTSGPAVRYAGADRFSTAAAVSAATYPGKTSAVFVATGEGFPDAVAGGSPAALSSSPILLVRQDTLPGSTAAELSRLGPSDIFVLGGTGAVSDAVAVKLGNYGTVTRLAGANRFETATAISKANFAAADVVYVATAETYPDALAGSVAAARDNAPVLLTLRDVLPAPTASELNRLKPSKIVVLGGTAAVSDAVMSKLGAYASTVTRIEGANRFATAAAISKSSFPTGAPVVYIATAENFPDALVGGAIAGHVGGPILLVSKFAVPGPTAGEISRLFGQPCAAFDAGCDAAYPDFCIKSPPPDLDCDDIGKTGFTVLQPDPHDLDRDGDGRGCEAGDIPPPQPVCDPSYPTVCIPPPPPDLDCSDIPYKNFTVLQPDPHGFDGNKDGIGCQ